MVKLLGLVKTAFPDHLLSEVALIAICENNRSKLEVQ
jgi:hypothetical protein